MDPLSYDTVCKPLCDKVEALRTNIEFLKCIKNNGSDGKNLIEKIDSTTKSMVDNVKELQKLLEKQQAIYNETKVQEVEISHLLYKVNVLHNIEIIQEEDSDNSRSDDAPNSMEIVDFSPMVLSNVASAPSRENMNAAQSLAFDIAYLDKEEYKLLPKYMVGRLTLEAINKFVDVINEAFSKKYNILSKPKSSLKNQELNLFKNYKRQITSQLKGKQFIIEVDIAKELNQVALEKKAYNFLTILRHSKRLIRNQIDGVVVYIATTNEW